MTKYFFFLVLFIPAILFAQNYIEVGDKYYNNNNFTQAISYYKKETFNKNKVYRDIAIEKLAITFIKLQDFEQSIHWLQKAVAIKPDNLKLLFELAESYKKIGNLDSAKIIFKELYSYNRESIVAQNISFCDTIRKWDKQKVKNYEISNLKELNTPFREFSPIIWNDTIYFVSAREQINEKKKETFNNKYSIHYLHIFSTPVNLKSNERTELKPTVFKPFSRETHEGPIIFIENGNTILMTNTHKGLKTPSTHIHPTQIFASYKENGKWLPPHNKYNMNDLENSTGHPSVSRDGKTMVYMSDRGSNFANTNLYIAKWNETARNWGETRILGDHINSRKNELFPYFDDEMNLYFSSEGLPGYGGLDIFLAKYIPEKDDWDIPVNLGAPINSPYDDFAYFEYNNTGTGFICSNREGGFGSDDIYIFSKNTDNIFIDHNIVKVQESVFFDNTKISLTDANENLLDKELHDNMFHLNLSKKGDPYSIIYNKNDSIVSNTIQFIFGETTDNLLYSIEVKPQIKDVQLSAILRNNDQTTSDNTKLYVFENDVLIDTIWTNHSGKYNYNCKAEKSYRFEKIEQLTQNLLPKYVKLNIYNSKNEALTNVQMNITKENRPFAKFRISKNNNVIRVPNKSNLTISASKKYHLSVDTTLNVNLPFNKDTLVVDLLLKEIPSFILKGLVYEEFKNEKIGINNVDIEFHYKNVIADNNHSYENGDYQIKAYPMEIVNFTFNKKGYVGVDTTFYLDTAKIKDLTINMKRITEGATVQLKEVYYEYNKAEVMEESYVNLEKLAKFLMANPSVIVELSSHTDARGNVNYNIDLSQRRAEAVTKYLISKGVKAENLIPKGYGASKLLVENAETEEEHQVNRRTEIKIIKMGEEKVDEYTYRVVIRTSNRPIDTSDKIFMEFPLLKSSINDTGELIYFLGNYKNTDDVIEQWENAIELGYKSLYIQRMLGNTLIDVIKSIAIFTE